MTSRPVLVSQRVDAIAERAERRDALDQRWTRFLEACGLLPILLPNVTTRLDDYLAIDGVSGIILTGGNDLAGLGAEDVTERDRLEAALIDTALRRKLPLLGICRGMQAIQRAFGVPLVAVPGHVSAVQQIRFDGRTESVNSYHNFGSLESLPPLRTRAHAADGVVEAIDHEHAPLLGIMWHPERMDPFAGRDLQLFRTHFGTS